jgi:hypothetical protein
MSSERHPSLAEVWVSSGRCRLHSLSYALLARVFGGLLAVSAWQLSVSALEAASELGLARKAAAGAVGSALLAAALLLLRWRQRVFATPHGLEIQRGKQRRIVPWDKVFDIREQPWMTSSPPWYPKMWQVYFVEGSSFDFIGVRQARAIVRAFWARYRSK